ncbi:exodeoxyribonuclease V subunit gamma [Vibrio breoganii]|uniref:exodeoxyribonuclease V subunit gamma n=1 Tax=Vibrio breoganii TaxID=553239 RepID=UPI000C838E19|nr:exodeoxyribonuclease V subunit gamma [Vibrio breoganii]PML97061.1 exodeoxyribonuclease V subunit gamma [Vibrio breoganii]PMN63094.1 exodeoxyribonuclease V subunit gamma [Vibrio breoganii]
MFTVYHSNQIDLLKSLLIALIRQQPLTSPFEQEQILVQSPGMSQWLKMELAKDMGIAANLNFPLPATFIWQMFIEVLPDVPKRSAFNKEAMTWKLMQVLPSKLEQDEFSSLASYLEHDEDNSKLFQLAGKIADIFDGYLVYRPDYITAWENNEHPAELEEQGLWQGELWRELYRFTEQLGQSKYHRANLYQDFIDKLASLSEINSDNVPKRLFVFGISSLPPKYLEALKALGEHIDVHLMFHNPCRYYWGDIKDQRTLAKMAAKVRPRIRWHEQELNEEQGIPVLKGDIEHNALPEFHHDAISNNLLASMGKQGRDNLHLLSELDSNEVEAFVDLDAKTLLQNIQQDILQLNQHQDDTKLEQSLHKQLVSKHDRSLSIHCCHSATREVEVLHDQLLHLFNQDSSLKPRDIIVMVADINAYSPAINAIFGNATGDRRIPYSISDRSVAEETPILNAFLQLLDLPNSRCGRSEMMEILETPAILQRFGLSASDFELINLWVEEAGVRWGLDDSTATEFELPSLNQNTWVFGLQRILLGYSMSAMCQPLELSSGKLAPYEQIEGMQAELAGKLAAFIDKVLHYRSALNEPQHSAQWQTQLNALANDFFELDIENEIALTSIRDALSSLTQQTTESGLDAALSHQVVSEYLQDKLDSSRVSQRFLAGQVNFCTLMPMRSIPFGVVCLLGMNDGVYPRTVAQEGFDLMTVKSRIGDRSRRDDDRYLFLEALLSAQQSLYISYIGQSILDNSECLPSILVTELLEYCSQNYCIDGDEPLSVDDSGKHLLEHLTSHHSMTPFSREAFENSQSFAAEWLPVVNGVYSQTAKLSTPLSDYFMEREALSEFELDQLLSFWSLPVKYFFNQRLQVWFNSEKELIEDEEPFSLGGLERYLLRDEIVAAMLNGGGAEVEQVAHYYRSSGQLPIGNFGDLEVAENQDAMRELVTEIEFYTSNKQPSLPVSLKVQYRDKWLTITGWLDNHYASGLVHYRVGRVRSKDILQAWIKHLCACASGVAVTSHLIGISSKKEIEYFSLAAIEPQDALDFLHDLVALYFEGMTNPLPYFPRSAHAAMQEFVKKSKKGDTEIAREAAIGKFSSTALGDDYNSGEADDMYIQRAWPQWSEALQQGGYQLAERVLLPAQERLQEKSK